MDVQAPYPNPNLTDKATSHRTHAKMSRLHALLVVVGSALGGVPDLGPNSCFQQDDAARARAGCPVDLIDRAAARYLRYALTTEVRDTPGPRRPRPLHRTSMRAPLSERAARARARARTSLTCSRHRVVPRHVS